MKKVDPPILTHSNFPFTNSSVHPTSPTSNSTPAVSSYLDSNLKPLLAPDSDTFFAKWTEEVLKTLVGAAMAYWDSYKANQGHTLDQLKHDLDGDFSCKRIKNKIANTEVTV
ncbi:hypothetical protein P7C70_g7664, partial [Phenoliferia sp. Uapishka_3]